MSSLYGHRAGSPDLSQLRSGGGRVQQIAAVSANQLQMAEYICEMILELRSMAKIGRAHV